MTSRDRAQQACDIVVITVGAILALGWFLVGLSEALR